MLPRTQDAGAHEIHERYQCQQPPAEAAHDPRIGNQLIQQGDDERDDRHDHQRSPDADRVIGEVDIPIANMRELVEDDGSECGRVTDRKRHETPGERELSTPRRSEGEAERPRVDRLPPKPGRRGHAGLGAQGVDLGPQLGRIRLVKWAVAAAEHGDCDEVGNHTADEQCCDAKRRPPFVGLR